MSFLSELKRARESPISAYHQFLLQNQNTAECVHAFFEGREDSSFYIGFLRRYVPHPKCLYFYKCGNKEGVYETFNKIMRAATSRGRALFFVDKDLSDFLNEQHIVAENIFVTNYYSIENYLVSEEMLLRISDDLLNLPDSIDTNKILEKFRIELERFYEQVLPITAWIIYLRRCKLRPNINNINLSHFFRFNDDLTLEIDLDIKQTNGSSILERMCEVTTPPGCQPEIESIVNELANLDPKLYVRGKFEIWFFVKFVGKLVKLLQGTTNTIGKRIKVRTQINEDNAVEILGPRLQIPSSLEKFLQENLSK